ncbi:aryl-alcohol dehydrogenase [Amylocystis lapponica]|nr:aryl-alcohol dehydrogenase [Amylocystis lapponica]
MSLFSPPPEPTTRLGRHRPLAPLAGVHVSPICLGAMNIGDKWGDYGFGEMDKENSFKLLDAFYEAGGNFIDTANNYQEETSELFIGEWMEKRGIREQIVVATKYTAAFKRTAQQTTHYAGNNMKALRVSLDASLAKLRTSYVDILYVHWWDWTCGVEEIMNGLHHLVAQGKVIYLGISDTPAWIVAKANTYARITGKTPFSIYQGSWSILQRDFEREIIPMVRSEGLALAPWNVLGGGKIRTDEEEEKRSQTGEKGRTVLGDWLRTPEERKVCLALEEVAKQVGTKSITAVAIAYVMQKTPYVFPIVGGRKVEHLMSNIEALSISLTPEQMKFLESAQPLEAVFPQTICGDGTETTFISSMAGHFDRWPLQQAIRPARQ